MKNLSFKQLFVALVIFATITCVACKDESKELDIFLTDIELRYEKAAFELGDAYWNYYAAEAEYDLKAPKKKFYEILVNDTLNQLIEKWYPIRTEIKDTLLQRRVEMWHNVLLSAKVEYDKDIMSLRGELEEMFEVTSDKDKENYDYAGNILKLVKMRNAKAVELGFENYVHLTFETNGLGYKWFLNFIETMDSETQNSYKNLVNELKQENDLKEFGQMHVFQLIGPYYRNIDAAELKDPDNIKMVKQSLANIGINYDELPAKLVEMELPAGIGGQGLMINIPNDFRAVMTLGMDIGVWMHEMGHGLHGLYNTINSPILEGYEWVPGNANPSFAEGMAETSAYFSRNVKWLKEYTNLSDEEIAERKEIVNKYATSFIRYHLYNFMQETELYLNPDKSFESIQKELAQKYLMIETDDIRTRELKNIIYVTYPLYLQNYLLADVVATQIHTALFEKFGEDYAFNKEIGEYLAKHFYGKGEYFNWNERLKSGTGKPIDVDGYLEYYKIK